MDAAISIVPFHPPQDGFAHSYTCTWKEQGMCATAWLDTVEREHFPAGLYLRNAYEVSSTYERTLGGPPRGARQEEIGVKLARKLRERMQEEMLAAGWQVVAKTREGRDIWQHKPKPARLSSPQQGTPMQVTVLRTARSVTFTCAVCGRETTQERMPGPKPRYCSDSCKQDGDREKTRLRVARFKARRRAARKATNTPKEKTSQQTA